MISKNVELNAKNDFKIKKKLKRFNQLPADKQEALIKKDRRWGRIVCRCEHIVEAEIIEALSNPLGARSLSAVKYRCRASMGRCQGGFCTQHIVRMMEKEFRMDIKDMKLKSPNSHLFIRRNRELSK
jgi:glycerol-3-phosphate dehydrogenase